jgi:hypothetical protein
MAIQATLSDAIKAQHEALVSQGEGLMALGEAIRVQWEISAKIAEAALLTAQALTKPDLDAPTAWLYSAAVDLSGKFNQSSRAGRDLIEISKGDGLHALVPGPRGRRPMPRETFVERGMEPRYRSGLPSDIGEYELGRFYDLAPRALQIAEANSTPPSSPEANTQGAT